MAAHLHGLAGKIPRDGKELDTAERLSRSSDLYTLTQTARGSCRMPRGLSPGSAMLQTDGMGRGGRLTSEVYVFTYAQLTVFTPEINTSEGNYIPIKTNK